MWRLLWQTGIHTFVKCSLYSFRLFISISFFHSVVCSCYRILQSTYFSITHKFYCIGIVWIHFSFLGQPQSIEISDTAKTPARCRMKYKDQFAWFIWMVIEKFPICLFQNKKNLSVRSKWFQRFTLWTPRYVVQCTRLSRNFDVIVSILSHTFRKLSTEM